MSSLAEYLGVVDFRQRHAVDETRPSPLLKLSVTSFCQDVINSKEYRDSLFRRILIDDLPPQVEVLLWHYGHGKPVEKVEVKDTTNHLEQLTAEQLEERAMYLVECARQLRAAQHDPPEERDESVH